MRYQLGSVLALGMVLWGVLPAGSQTVAPPPLPDIKNPGAVNPSVVKPQQPGLEPLKPLEDTTKPAPVPTGSGFFDDALVAVKTTNSVFAEVLQIPAFKALTTEEARRAYVQKYMTDRVSMLLKTAAELAPGKLAASLTETDKQFVDAFATNVAKGTYKVQEMPAEPGFQNKLGQLLEHLKTASNQLPAGLEPDQQAEALSRDAQDWLVRMRILKPNEISTNDTAILNDLARMVVGMKATPAPPTEHNKPAPTEPETPAPVEQPTVNRVAQHQPALTEFLNTLPQTLLNRGGPQNYNQMHDQMLDIALRALQQQFLGGQALTDDERNHVVGLVDQALKPFESLVGRILHPQYPTNIFQPSPLQPIATQPAGLQPTMISPYSQVLPLTFGVGTICPIFGLQGYRGVGLYHLFP